MNSKYEGNKVFLAPCLYPDDPIYTKKGAFRDNEWEAVEVGYSE